MRPKKETQKSKRGTLTSKAFTRFTDEERAAMKDRAQKLKAEARRGPRAKMADGEGEVLATITEIPEPGSRPSLSGTHRRENGLIVPILKMEWTGFGRIGANGLDYLRLALR